MTDQQTGQKIQIVTAVDASGSPKQQFILTSPDGAGTGKVILASPETSSAKQLIFTTSDNLVPGRIQVRPVTGICSSTSATKLVSDSSSTMKAKSVSKRSFEDLQAQQPATLAKVKNQRVSGKGQKAASCSAQMGWKLSQENQQPMGDWHEQAGTKAARELFCLT